MKLIIDRIEGNFAVCETEKGDMVQLPTEALPQNICEGAVLDIVYNEEETLKRKANVKAKLKKIFNK